MVEQNWDLQVTTEVCNALGGEIGYRDSASSESVCLISRTPRLTSLEGEIAELNKHLITLNSRLFDVGTNLRR